MAETRRANDDDRGFRLRRHRRRRRSRRIDGRHLAGESRTARHPVRARPVSALPHRRIAAGVGQRCRSRRSARTSLVRQAGFPQKWGATFMSADGSHRTLRGFRRRTRRASASNLAGVASHLRRSAAATRGVERRRRPPAASRRRRVVRRRRRDDDGAGRRIRAARRCGPGLSSTPRAEAPCCRESSTCGSTSRVSPMSPCSRTTPACLDSRAVAPAISASSRETTSGGSG